MNYEDYAEMFGFLFPFSKLFANIFDSEHLVRFLFAHPLIAWLSALGHIINSGYEYSLTESFQFKCSKVIFLAFDHVVCELEKSS